MKKFISYLTVFSLSLFLFVPATTVFAEEEISEGKEVVEEKLELIVEDLEAAREEAEAAGQEVVVDEIDKEFDIQGFNPETIYDLDSIGTRIELLIKISEIIRFSTTELARKVSAAHTKVAGLVGIGLVKVANPFEDQFSLEAYIDKLEASKEELMAYPDLSFDDVATIYVISDLDKILHKGRWLPSDKSEEGVYYKSEEVKRKLRKTMHEITLERLKPQITVMEVEDLIFLAEEAIKEAQAAPDELATKAEIDDLVKALRKARKYSVKELDRGSAARRSFDKLIAEITFKVRLKFHVSSAEVKDAMAVIELARIKAAAGEVCGDLEASLKELA